MIEAARLGIYVGADTDDAEKGIRRVSHQAEKRRLTWSEDVRVGQRDCVILQVDD